MTKGFLNLVLHAHLPFVRHPEYSDSFEERWLFEAITETYIPLLLVFEHLINRNIKFKITMSITPPLAEMLTDQFLQDRYIRHIENLIELAEKEKFRTRTMPEFHSLSLMYYRKFTSALSFFKERCGKNLLNAFLSMKQEGAVEIITCCATHGFLPVMASCPESVRAQIAVGTGNYRKHFKDSPRGIWLAECGWHPGHDKYLSENGIKYFFVDSHAIQEAVPHSKYGLFAPILCADTKIAAFARDSESSRQVWSSHEGYPGDFDYREFYRDVGYDLPFEYIKPYIHEMGTRINTGVKYYRITGKTDQKLPYNEERAIAKTKIHAEHFLASRVKQSENLLRNMDRPPIITCPYDAELYGHWWYEGPEFIKNLFITNHELHYPLKSISGGDYLDMYYDSPIADPVFSSWGHEGYCAFWLDECNDWIYMHLHKCQKRMNELADLFCDNADILTERALNQAARELMLAQSSDWAFIIKSGTCIDYAEKRTKDHIINFTELYSQIKSNKINTEFLEDIEFRNNIFSEIDFRLWKTE